MEIIVRKGTLQGVSFLHEMLFDAPNLGHV